MGRERRKWTDKEDSLLREAVKKATQESRPLLWRELAKSIPGRTNKDCRRRWFNTLADGMVKGSWTESEDERLCNAVQQYGSKWTRVAATVGTRNSDQCSSHWSQSLNPDINYSDWTKDEDERLLHAVQQYGTNWTIIVSTHLPNRTTLALKNRFSALRTKTCQICTTLTNEPRSKMRSHRPSANQCSNRLNFSESIIVTTNRGEADNQTIDDTDEDDEQDDDDDDDNEVLDAGNSVNMNWQESLQVNTNAAPRQGSSAHMINQSSRLSLPAQGDIQWPFNHSSTTVEQWNDEVQNPTIYSSAFPFSCGQNSYPDHHLHMSVLPGMGTDCTTSSVPLHSYQHSHKLGVPQAAPSAPNPAAAPAADILGGGIDYTSPNEPVDSRSNKNKSSPAPWIGLTPDSTAQPDHRTTQYQDRMVPGSGVQDQSLACSNAAAVASSPGQKLDSVGLSSSDRTLQHVSIDAVCTTEQLGNIMRTLVGLAKSVTVKVNS